MPVTEHAQATTEIPLFRPAYDEEELEAVREVLESGWVGLGPKTREFEERFAEYVGMRYAVGTNSASAALHLSMIVTNAAGGEVITSPMTFVSTNHAILYVGAEPVFCDVEPDTMNIDAQKLEALVTRRTKAIVLIHYGGYACDMETILDIAERHGIAVVEDAAHGCGGEWNGRKLGAIGDLGVFSFHAVKNLAMGEGGAVTTNDEAVYKRLLKLRWMGITRDTWSRALGAEGYAWAYDVEELGFKYHLSDIAAAIGLVQLRKLDAANVRRRELVVRYDAGLAGISGLDLPGRRPYQTLPAAHNYVVRTTQRDALNAFLKARGIATGVHYIPNNLYELYRPYRGETPVAAAEWRRLLTLPVYPRLPDEEQDRVIAAVREFFGV
jgi:perosamine synthetase